MPAQLSLLHLERERVQHVVEVCVAALEQRAALARLAQRVQVLEERARDLDKRGALPLQLRAARRCDLLPQQILQNNLVVLLLLPL